MTKITISATNLKNTMKIAPAEIEDYTDVLVNGKKFTLYNCYVDGDSISFDAPSMGKSEYGFLEELANAMPDTNLEISTNCESECEDPSEMKSATVNFLDEFYFRLSNGKYLKWRARQPEQADKNAKKKTVKVADPRSKK